MDNIKRIPLYKWGLAVICQISITLFAVAVLIASVGHVWELRDWMERKNQNFWETPVYQDISKSYIEELAKYIIATENFQTDSTFDEKRVVDIFDYVERGAITGQTLHGLSYYLGDLRAWQNNSSAYEGEELTELSVPIGYDSIEAFAGSAENLLEFSADEWKRYLKDALDLLKKDINTYSHTGVQLKEGSSNFSYIVTNMQTNKVYSNTDQAVAQLMAQDQYFRFRTGEYSIDTNINFNSRFKYELMEMLGNDLADIGEYEIITCIDTDLPVKDRFQEAKHMFDQWSPLLETAFWMALIGGLVALAAFCILCAMAGRIKGYEGILMHPIDKIKLEILIFLFLLTSVGYVVILFALTTQGDNIRLMIGGTGIASFFLSCFLLTEIFSFVRRGKAGILWTRSYSYIIFQGFLAGMRHTRQSWRVILTFLGYLLLSFIFVQMDGLGILLLIFLNVYVASRLLRAASIREEMIEGVKKIADGDLEYQIPSNNMGNAEREMTQAINRVAGGLQKAVKSGMQNERLKTDLITNVSHDIKTPLTSIINYVGLLKRENIENPKIQNYIEILDSKSQRLKHLTEDLVEASRISSGNIEIICARLNFKELINQIEGEFIEKFESRNLEIVRTITREPMIIMADGRRLWRVLENIYNNVIKYAMPGTRVYIDARIKMGWVYFSVKNISEYALNIETSELTERFIRGDVSRSTEGSGLGLSIAKSLTTLQHGTFDIYLDGDLFKVTVRFPVLLGQSDGNLSDEEGN